MPARLRDKLTFGSRIRYVWWRLTRGRNPLTVRLRNGLRFPLRPLPSWDTSTAYEIFVSEVYRCPTPERVRDARRVVDLGANIGLSCLYLTEAHPGADIIAFEPHPVHVGLIRQVLTLNGLEGRVQLHAAAAGVEPGSARLTDAEIRSAVVRDGGSGSGTVEITVEDFFRAVGREPIDLLKMDIEGGEFVLLADPRFASLGVRAVVLEWHDTPDHPDGRGWCVRRLTELGYAVQDGAYSAVGHGIIWAYPVEPGPPPRGARADAGLGEVGAAQ